MPPSTCVLKGLLFVQWGHHLILFSVSPLLSQTPILPGPMVVSMGLYRKHEMAKRNFVDFLLKVSISMSVLLFIKL